MTNVVLGTLRPPRIASAAAAAAHVLPLPNPWYTSSPRKGEPARPFGFFLFLHALSQPGPELGSVPPHEACHLCAATKMNVVAAAPLVAALVFTNVFVAARFERSLPDVSEVVSAREADNAIEKLRDAASKCEEGSEGRIQSLRDAA
eukprot:scaffold4161_cov22-Prasinocladus_malaysianus.AAC.1